MHLLKQVYLDASPEGYKHDDLLVSLDAAAFVHFSQYEPDNWLPFIAMKLSRQDVSDCTNRTSVQEQQQKGKLARSWGWTQRFLYHRTVSQYLTRAEWRQSFESPREGKGMCQVIDPSRCPTRSSGNRIRDGTGNKAAYNIDLASSLENSSAIQDHTKTHL